MYPLTRTRLGFLLAEADEELAEHMLVETVVLPFRHLWKALVAVPTVVYESNTLLRLRN